MKRRFLLKLIKSQKIGTIRHSDNFLWIYHIRNTKIIFIEQYRGEDVYEKNEKAYDTKYIINLFYDYDGFC